MSFEDAVRQFLESFKLPGEAQKIIRILEAWSRQFYAQCPGIFSGADAVYILAISVIMLNTDKHNPAVCLSRIWLRCMRMIRFGLLQGRPSSLCNVIEHLQFAHKTIAELQRSLLGLETCAPQQEGSGSQLVWRPVMCQCRSRRR